MTTPLVDILQGLKRNTFAWAKLWVLNGAPDEFYPNEHHIITAALTAFRARYRAATEEEQHNLTTIPNRSIKQGPVYPLGRRPTSQLPEPLRWRSCAAGWATGRTHARRSDAPAGRS